ncbi:MAG: hypothetical protein AABY64_09305 [Bdellovibrionota bacterium]
MKLTLSLATVSLLSSALIAQADTGSGYDILREGGKTTARLEHCGGSARLEQRNRRPVLVINGVKDCTNLSVDGEYQGKLERRGSTLSGEVVIHERKGKNVHTITLSSNSRKTSDVVRVESQGSQGGGSQGGGSSQRANIVFEFGWFSHVLGASQWSRLHECGGTVDAVVQENDITLKFKDVERCSKFDILSANGDSLNYEQKRLNDSRGGGFNGSFTIPQRYIKAGGNAVKVILRSNSGKNDDVILIRFKGL